MTRTERIGSAVLAAIILWALVAYPTLDAVACLRGGPTSLRWLTIAGEAGIAAAYAWIPLRLVSIWLRLRVRPHAVLLVLYGAFIVACGATHALGIALFWWPAYWIAAKLKVITAAISLAVAYVTDREQASIIGLGEQGAALALKAAEVEAKARELDVRTAELSAALMVTERQRATIQGLSIPLLQIDRDVVLVPLIGVLDSERAAHVTAALLHQIERGRATKVLLDMTGVDAIDTATAKNVIDLVRAVALMGGRTVITGIQPAVAQTMVALGISIDAETHRTIAQGLGAVRA